MFTWEMTLKYQATGIENVNSEGTINVHEFCNDDYDDIDLTLKVDKSSDLATDAFREAVRVTFRDVFKPWLVELFGTFLEDLK